MSWPLALVIVAILFVGSCAYFISSSAKSTVDLIDYGARAVCYETGYYNGVDGLKNESPPFDKFACQRFYSDGFKDGESGSYDPPE